MKHVCYSLLLLWSCCTGVRAQTSGQQAFCKAKTQLKAMLTGAVPSSYEEAIFTIENAWYNNGVDRAAFDSAIGYHLSRIEAIIAAGYHPETITEKPSLLRSKADIEAQYRRALSNWAIYTYMTQELYFADSNSLEYHQPYSYSYTDPKGSSDWTNTQVVHLNNTGQGNCFAMASLFKILADRLHTGAQLCVAPNHIYISHADDKGTQYNIELGSRGHFPGTGEISAITYTTDQAIRSNIAQKALTGKEAVALALVYLAKGYEHKFSIPDDAFTLGCADAALQYDPRSLNALLLKTACLEKKLAAEHKPIGELRSDPAFSACQSLIATLYNLGYREMPWEMKNTLIRIYSREGAAADSANIKAQLSARIATVSWGLFEERHNSKETERFGNTLFHTQTKTITAFVAPERLYNNYDFDPVIFALNLDPLAAKYPHASPYNFVENNPLSRIDPTGADWILSTGNKIYWYGGKVGDKKNLLTVFKATSGYKGPDASGKKWNLQNSKYQNVANGGPTAEGRYYIKLKPDPERVAQADSKTGELKRNPDGGIEKIPDFVENPKKKGFGWRYPEWGKNRAHLEPVNVTGATSAERDNNSYYFHDSEKGYSHGCTECETTLFEKLKEYRDAGNDRIDVIVDYPSEDHNTNGGTQKPATK